MQSKIKIAKTTVVAILFDKNSEIASQETVEIEGAYRNAGKVIQAVNQLYASDEIECLKVIRYEVEVETYKIDPFFIRQYGEKVVNIYGR